DDLVTGVQTCALPISRDRRLFLGLHLGAFLMNWQRVATPDERKFARKICDKLDDKISDLREQLIEEFKSELLEIQQGRIKALSRSEERSVGNEMKRWR